MGSGISTKYGKTYFYRLKDEAPLSVKEKSYRYIIQDTHTIESHNDDEVIKFCEDMVSRKPYEDSNYAQNLANTARHFEMNPNGTFGKPGNSSNIRVIESDYPMNSAMNFYSEMGEGGQMKYLSNHHGIQSRLMDGTDVTFRPYPKSEGSPAVEVRIRFESIIHKIHFIQR